MGSGRSLSFRQKILFKGYKAFKKSEAQEHPLKYLFWECTLRCNLSCLHCGSDCHVSNSIPDMPADHFLKEMKHLTGKYNSSDIMVVITGGEPLLRKDLPQIGKELRQMGYRWGIVTNGYALSPVLFNNLMNSGMGALTLSLDGLEEQHNWLRNDPKAFDRAMEALDLICASQRLNSDVVTCVNMRNIDHLDEIYSLLIEKGVKNWRLFTITPIGRAISYSDLDLADSDFKKLTNFISVKRKEQSELKINFSCESYLGSLEGEVRDGLFFCRAGIHIGSILADGSVSACPNIDRRFIQGNIYENHLDEIWETRFKPFRDRSWTKKDQCAECNEYKYCEGSGMHWWQGVDCTLQKCHKKVLDY